ncbi:hypothetical protein M427DRAFT_33443 [Gonapodya prolifera JEL478]|uniref:Uncharacterized protein n=1 Tax=Gonapodya prolifera (strain JEL478) TaxID=1344416 RepID=A0A139AC57_GONPJ|nr:hypothetical protein M427DRAFT_33443 [Gonapodya prolifera JEL478]|eukprot:KXS14013.1 hypothetical protein M427DRAFT_33443 [Gonapodya prolifera JEL478]
MIWVDWLANVTVAAAVENWAWVWESSDGGRLMVQRADVSTEFIPDILDQVTHFLPHTPHDATDTRTYVFTLTVGLKEYAERWIRRFDTEWFPTGHVVGRINETVAALVGGFGEMRPGAKVVVLVGNVPPLQYAPTLKREGKSGTEEERRQVAITGEVVGQYNALLMDFFAASEEMTQNPERYGIASLEACVGPDEEIPVGLPPDFTSAVHRQWAIAAVETLWELGVLA